MLLKLRATLAVALFLFTNPVFSQSKIKKTETYRDIIEKAQNLILQKDRQQAVNILANAIRREGPKSAASVELKKTLEETATLFLSDKAQQIYEIGVTLKRTDLNQAQQKMTEGMRLEPDNLLFLLEQGRIAVAKGDCSAAEEFATKAHARDPYFEEVNLLRSQAALCTGHPLETQKTTETQTIKKSPLAKFWLILEVEKFFKDKNFAKSLDVVQQVKKIDAAYPETEYWLWKNDLALKRKNPAAAEKYVMDCKNISAHLFRQYMIDPMLCRRVAEVESGGNE